MVVIPMALLATTMLCRDCLASWQADSGIEVWCMTITLSYFSWLGTLQGAVFTQNQALGVNFLNSSPQTNFWFDFKSDTKYIYVSYDWKTKEFSDLKCIRNINLLSITWNSKAVSLIRNAVLNLNEILKIWKLKSKPIYLQWNAYFYGITFIPQINHLM